MKTPVVYRSPETVKVPLDSLIQEFYASQRPKLSIHHDGFCQFSSDLQGSIRSGRDPETGEPKGIGIFISPLNKPITTGPTFGINLWGLNDFKAWTNVKKDESPLRFHEYYSRKSVATTHDSYLIEGYLFPKKEAGPNIVISNGKYYLSVRHKNFEIPGTVFRYSIIPEFNNDYLIGIMVSKSKVGFKTESGFSLGGPSQIVGYDNMGHQIGHSLNAIYPVPDTAYLPEMSLDYVAKECHDEVLNETKLEPQ